jgi:hypothetical protein
MIEILPAFYHNKVHYRVLNTPPLIAILNQINPINIGKPDFSMIHFNIIFPSVPKLSMWSLFKGLPNKAATVFVIRPTYFTPYKHNISRGKAPDLCLHQVSAGSY